MKKKRSDKRKREEEKEENQMGGVKRRCGRLCFGGGLWHLQLRRKLGELW